MNFSRPLALVTGASCDTGGQISLDLARSGHDLILIARTSAALENLAAQASEYGAQCTVLAADLAEPEAATKIVREIQRKNLQIEVVVNNASSADLTFAGPTDPTTLNDMILRHLQALTDLTRAFLPGMISRRHGQVILSSSVEEYHLKPGTTAYCATKAYVYSLHQAISEELAGTGVTVGTLRGDQVRSTFSVLVNGEGLPRVHGKPSPVLAAGHACGCGVKALLSASTTVLKSGATLGGRSLKVLSLLIARFMLPTPKKV